MNIYSTQYQTILCEGNIINTIFGAILSAKCFFLHGFSILDNPCIYIIKCAILPLKEFHQLFDFLYFHKRIIIYIYIYMRQGKTIAFMLKSMHYILQIFAFLNDENRCIHIQNYNNFLRISFFRTVDFSTKQNKYFKHK